MKSNILSGLEPSLVKSSGAEINIKQKQEIRMWLFPNSTIFSSQGRALGDFCLSWKVNIYVTEELANTVNLHSQKLKL